MYIFLNNKNDYLNFFSCDTFGTSEFKNLYFSVLKHKMIKSKPTTIATIDTF